MIIRPVALALMLAALPAAAQDVRALIGEQQQFVRSLARGREQSNVWLVEWRNEALARRDGTATGGLSAADVQHFNAHRAQVPNLRFLAWAEAGAPGLRSAIDRAFLAVATPIQASGYSGTSQQFLQSAVEPRKNAEVRQLLDLLHRATARLSREAQARGLPQPLVAGANGVPPVTPALPPVSAAPPVTPPLPPVSAVPPAALPPAPPPAGSGGSLLGIGGGTAGRALPGGYVPPAGLPVPAQPPVALRPGPAAWPGQTPFAPPQNQSITIVIDPQTLEQLLQLVAWMQRTGQMPGFAPQAGPPAINPGQFGVPNPGQYGMPTGSYWDQAMRGQGIRIIIR